MRINADFSQPAIIMPENYHWVESPKGEVKRMMLDRIGTEKARATSLVEFGKHSTFPEHQHPLGEEVLVLSGVFTENSHLHYPQGWYLRNPHQSSHQVSSQEGCLIFVKLMQMSEDEKQRVQINTNDPQNWKNINNLLICPLFESEQEKTYLVQLQPSQQLIEDSKQGLEIFILEGQLLAEDHLYMSGCWLRLPIDSKTQFTADLSGAKLYIKTRHLQHTIDMWSKPE